MSTVFTLTLSRTEWSCDCPGAFNADGGYAGTQAREAARDAVHHVRYYRDVWPHRIVRVGR